MGGHRQAMNSRRERRSVLVLNQYAKPRGEAGSSRHSDLFGRVRGWHFRVLSGDRDLYSRDRYASHDPNFELVPVLGYERNDGRRILNWVSYCLGAFVASFRGPRPAVVYGSSPHLLAPLTALVLARVHRARFVFEVRDLWPRSLVDLGHLRAGSALHRVLRGVETWLYRRADRIVLVTDGMREHLAELGVDLAKVVTISNGAAPEDFGPRPGVTPLRERVPVRGRLLVFAGAHGAKDGLDAVLDAASALPDDTFVLIGDGTDKPRVIERARTEGLANVHFLGLMPKTELRAVLGGADVGLHTVADVAIFRLGMSPNKLYDYLAAGLPVVTNAPGEPHAIVAAARAGVGVDPDRLAAGIEQVTAAGPDELARMSRNAVEYMRTTKSPSVAVRHLQQLLDEVVPDPQRVAAAPDRASA